MWKQDPTKRGFPEEARRAGKTPISLMYVGNSLAKHFPLLAERSLHARDLDVLSRGNK